MSPWSCSAALMISNGGNVIRFSCSISSPRSFIQLGSMGSAAEQRRLQSSQVVQVMIVSTIFWFHFSRPSMYSVSYTHLRAHETRHDLVCRLLLEKKKRKQKDITPHRSRT